MVTEKSISQISDLWKEEKRQFVKKSTFAAYSLIVETHLLPAFGHLTAVTEKDVQDFVLHKLNGGLSQKTIKDMLIVLRMILKYGAKKNYCVYAPIDVIFPTDWERQELEVLSIANQKKIMRFVEDNFILIFYNTDDNHPAVIKRKDTEELISHLNDIASNGKTATDDYPNATGNNSPIVQKENSLEPQGFKRVSLGGEREIRTLEPFLTVTRFPVVRPRPTRRFLQKILNFTTLKLYLIYKALSNDIRRNSAKYA